MIHSSQTATVKDAENDGNADAMCWSCSASLGTSELFCGACGRIQPLPSEIDYFNVFGLPRKLKLDGASLERDFYRLSRRLHPDVYAQGTPQEQEWSLANSSLLNDAYRTLKDPVRRTEYLLKLEGIVTADQGGRTPTETVPADLLEEVFELNMQLDEMQMNRNLGEDDPQLQKDLTAAKTNFDQQLEATNASLSNLWERWDAAVDEGDEFKKLAVKEEIATLLDRRRYIRNLVNRVHESLEA